MQVLVSFLAKPWYLLLLFCMFSLVGSLWIKGRRTKSTVIVGIIAVHSTVNRTLLVVSRSITVEACREKRRASEYICMPQSRVTRNSLVPHMCLTCTSLDDIRLGSYLDVIRIATYADLGPRRTNSIFLDDMKRRCRPALIEPLGGASTSISAPPRSANHPDRVLKLRRSPLSAATSTRAPGSTQLTGRFPRVTAVYHPKTSVVNTRRAPVTFIDSER